MASRAEYGLDAVGRCVGISCWAFCTACGHARKLFLISSGAKSFAWSQVPASRPTTSIPACVNGSTATPPVAPMPITTTSVFLSVGIRKCDHEGTKGNEGLEEFVFEKQKMFVFF